MSTDPTVAEPRELIVTEWAGIPNYECPVVLPSGQRCPYANVEREAVELHMKRLHPTQDAAAPAVQPLGPDERDELSTLREENAGLKRELTSTKGQLTRAKNQLEQLKPGDGDVSPPDNDEAADDVADDQGD